jgi:outer membrane protein TolC
MRLTWLALLLTFHLDAEVRTFTLREAVDLALRQNPDLMIARLDELKAAEAVRMAREPFTPKLFAGSGLAYVNGFPMSIEGSAPSVFQARAIQSLYNRPKSFQVAQARENQRTAAIDTVARRDEIVWRTASLYLDLERLVRSLDLARQQLASLEKVAASVQARVAEGRELPIENRKAALSLAQARQRLAGTEADREYAEGSLALLLGFAADDRIETAGGERPRPELPASEGDSVAAALANSKEIKRLESALQAKGFELRAAGAARYPQIDLVAQYGLLARFNNYEDFFRSFQRNNGQIGVSISIPVIPGAAPAAQVVQAELDIRRLRTEVTTTRGRIAVETRRSYQEMKKAETAREVARLDLEVTREQLSVLLAQMEEGRVGLRQVEELRSVETGKWLAFVDAQHLVEKTQLDVLKQTGTLIAALH